MSADRAPWWGNPPAAPIDDNPRPCQGCFHLRCPEACPHVPYGVTEEEPA